MGRNGQRRAGYSSVLEFENRRNPLALRRDWMSRCLEQADHYQAVNPIIRERAEFLGKKHLGAIVALHVATAEAAGYEYFLSCDDRLLKKRKLFSVKAKNPVDFV